MERIDEAISSTRGFMKSRVILTAAELDIFTRIDTKPCGAKELAGEKSLDERAATRVLDCLVSFGLLEKESGRYKLSEEGSLFSARHPQTILPMALHTNHLWDTWSDLTDVVKKGGSAGLDSGVQMNRADWNSFIGAMHVRGQKLAQSLVKEYDLSRFKRLLDVGGASGTYTIAFLRRKPTLTAVLFDLKNVTPMAEERLAAEHLAGRVEIVTGDFYKDELPKGCDLAFLSAIIHQNSFEQNLALFAKIFRALEPGGTVLIRDHIMKETRTEPAAGALFAINMLVNTRGGDTYTFAEVKEALEKAGFTGVKQLRFGGSMDSLVEGRKPGPA